MIGLNLNFFNAFKNSVFNKYGVGEYQPHLVAQMTDDYFLNGSRKRFDDLFTHSRLGNATMVDSDGLLKWGPHNLLTYSEQFDNGAWTKTSSSVSADATTAPDGTATADKLIEASATAQHYLYDAATVVSGSNYTLSIFAKAAERDFIILSLGAQFTANEVWFDLGNGAVGTNNGADSASITDFGGGWYLCSITEAATASGSGISYYKVAASDGSNSYTGDGTSGIYIWGAHLYRSDLGGMASVPADARVAGSETYVPTTSTAKYLPRRHNHVYNGSAWVDAGTLIETEARTNLLTYSEDLADASWTKATVTVESAANTDGAAFKVNRTGDGYEAVSKSVSKTASATDYTFSIRVKKDVGDFFVVTLQGSGSPQRVGVCFNLETESVALSPSVNGTFVSLGSEITADGGDYKLIKVSCTSDTHTAITPYFSPSLVARQNVDSTAIGSGPSSVIVKKPQLEEASTPSSYIPTNGSTVTRAADTTGLTIDSSIVPWPTPKIIGNELVTNGTFDTDLTGWVDASSGGGTATVSSGICILSGNGTGTGRIRQSITTEVGKVYQVSFDATMLAERIVFNMGTTEGASDVLPNQSIATGSSTFVIVASTTTTWLNFFSNIASESYSFDNISVKEINPLAVCIQMKGRASRAPDGAFIGVSPFRWYFDGSNFIDAIIRSDGNDGQVLIRQRESGTNDQVFSASGTYSPGINVPFNIASRHGSTFITGAVDGTALTADLTPVALPDLSSNALQIGYDFMGNIEQVRLWVVDIGDTGIAEASS